MRKGSGPSGSSARDRIMALRARPIAASTRLLPSRWWRRTAGPRSNKVLRYLVASGPLMEARSRDRSGSWRPFGLTGEASPPYSSTPYATGDGEARRSGIVQGRQCDRALLVPAVVLCGCAGSARVSLAVHVWRRENGEARVRRLGIPRMSTREHDRTDHRLREAGQTTEISGSV